MNLNLQHPQVATTDTPPPPYWERTQEEQAGVVEFVASGELYHIEDDTGQSRRLAEGWCSLGGIDWQDEDVPPAVFEGAVEEYAKKNPIILWDHKREFPLGRLLEWEVSTEGLFVRFQVLDARHFDNPDTSEILKNCDQVWALMRRGIVRGLSWDGRARKRYVWSAELNQYVKQPVQILMSEITVTPVQVHPGAKVTGVNTLSKALRICKALVLGPTDDASRGVQPMDPKLKAALEAQKAYAEALHSLGDGAELPPELIEAEEKISKALGLQQATPPPPANPVKPADPPALGADLQEAISKALGPLQQKIDSLDARVNGRAPLRRQVGGNPDPVSNPKPGDRVEMTVEEQTSKALKMGGNVRDGKLDRGTGKPVRGVTGEDLMGLVMMNNGMTLNWPGKPPEISLPTLDHLMELAA